jgi:predicted secreted protein
MRRLTRRLTAGFLSFMLCCGLISANAQTPLQTSGALVIVPAYSEVKHPNDEARVTLMIEEQDKDKTAAASRVNLKMRQGTEIVKREDPQATLKTRGYYTYPVYPDEQPPRPYGNKPRQAVGWRVGQYLEVTTTNLAALPKTVAATQKVLALNGLHFGLTEATARKLDEKRIEATYSNLNQRIAAISKAMGRNMADVVLDTVDFEASGAYAQTEAQAPKTMRAAAMESGPVEEPSFEPGETTLSMRAVGKIRFK